MTGELSDELPDKLRGRPAADAVLAEVEADVRDLLAHGAPLCLVTVLVGDNPASAMYVEMKHADSAKHGIPTRDVRLPATVTQAELEATLAGLSGDPTVTSILVQYPLPHGLDYFAALRAIDPNKDVDGLHPVNLGLLTAGDPSGVVPCTPSGIVNLLQFHGVPFEKADVTIVGRGLTVGRPLSILMSTNAFGLNCTVTLCHSRSGSLARDVAGSEVLICAAGAPGLITADMVREDHVVVTAGVAFVDGKATSDLTKEAEEKVRAITPTVGGVGPMTRAFLFRNAVVNARSQS